MSAPIGRPLWGTPTKSKTAAATAHISGGQCCQQPLQNRRMQGSQPKGKGASKKSVMVSSCTARKLRSQPGLGESLSSSLGGETWIACTQATSTAGRGRATPTNKQQHQLPSKGGGTMGGSKTRGAAADGLPLGIPPHSEPHGRPSNAENTVAPPSGPPQPCLLPHRQREASGSQKAALTLSTTTTVSTTSDPRGQQPPLGRRFRQGSSPTASTEAIHQICPQASVAHEPGGRLLSARTGRSRGPWPSSRAQ